MIEAATWDIRVQRHAPFPSADPITLTDEITGVPIDITGATVIMEIRLYEGAAGAALLTPTLTVADGPRGQIGPPTVSEAQHEALIAAATANSQTLQSELKLRHDIKISGVAGWPATVVIARGFYYVQTGVTL